MELNEKKDRQLAGPYQVALAAVYIIIEIYIFLFDDLASQFHSRGEVSIVHAP